MNSPPLSVSRPSTGKGSSVRAFLMAASTVSGLRLSRGRHSRPSGGGVSQRQGVEKAAMRIAATMGHQISFQKAGPVVIPLRKGADRDLVLEQGTSFGGGETVRSGPALRTQQPFGGPHTHRQ